MAETTAHGKYGIDLTLEGYTIESYNETESPRREEVPNQKNQVVKEIRYDTRYELRLTVRGNAKPSTDAITFNGNYKLTADFMRAEGEGDGVAEGACAAGD